MESLGHVPETRGRIVELSGSEWDALMHLYRQVPDYRSDGYINPDVVLRADEQVFELIEVLAQAIENKNSNSRVAVRVEHTISIQAAEEAIACKS